MQEFLIPKNLGKKLILAKTYMYLICIFGKHEVWKSLWLKGPMIEWFTASFMNGLPLHLLRIFK